MSAGSSRPWVPGAGIIGGEKGYGSGAGLSNPNAIVLWDRDVFLNHSSSMNDLQGPVSMRLDLPTEVISVVIYHLWFSLLAITVFRGTDLNTGFVDSVVEDAANQGVRSGLEEVKSENSMIRVAPDIPRSSTGDQGGVHGSAIARVNAGLRVATGIHVAVSNASVRSYSFPGETNGDDVSLNVKGSLSKVSLNAVRRASDESFWVPMLEALVDRISEKGNSVASDDPSMCAIGSFEENIIGRRTFASILSGMTDLSSLPEPVTEGGLTRSWADAEDKQDPEEVEEGEINGTSVASVDNVLFAHNEEDEETMVHGLEVVNTGNGDQVARIVDQENDTEVQNTELRIDLRYGDAVLTSSPGRVEVLFDNVATVVGKLSGQGEEFVQVGKRPLGHPPGKGKK
ncbi:hypothetical protein NE237_002766 [Protea cynaroides]|uniref:Uncharacterized protein n=1 Tax=Protea cynaroides TaxID=273540 RepID=A0A9Q0KFQ1_9MAGN|nr:hypothetical protein NE237_002766 [Protea cynaroides]